MTNAVSAVLRAGDRLRIGPVEIAEENGWITVSRCGVLIARLASCGANEGRTFSRHVCGFPYSYGGGSIFPELIRVDDLGRGAELSDPSPDEAPLAIIGQGDSRREVRP